MSRATTHLYLDDRQSMGVDFGNGERPDYPILTAEEERIANVFAAGLFVSKSAIQWALRGALDGDKDSFRYILNLLSGGKLRRLTRA